MRASLGFAIAALFFASALQAAEPTMCTMQYDPVCAVKDGEARTYGNSCVAGAEGAVVAYRGECRKEESYVPPASCTAWFDGCNRCSRTENGEAACTLMACAGEPQPGYCTSYASGTAAEVGERKTTPAIEESLATTGTSAADVTVGSFFTRLWTYLLARLGSIF